MPRSEFVVEQERVFDLLCDPNWFHGFVKYQYQAVVFGMSQVQPGISGYLCEQAHQRWVKDVSRVSDHEFDGGPLDHFKRAALLCYWLRRYPPICEFGKNPDLQIAGIRFRKFDGREVRYANQFAAFDVGFRICRFWEANREDAERIYGFVPKEGDFSLAGNGNFVQDVSYVLADKNVSPHTLALIYRALFIDILAGRRRSGP